MRDEFSTLTAKLMIFSAITGAASAAFFAGIWANLVPLVAAAFLVQVLSGYIMLSTETDIVSKYNDRN
jgi:hypothetical protein